MIHGKYTTHGAIQTEKWNEIEHILTAATAHSRQAARASEQAAKKKGKNVYQQSKTMNGLYVYSYNLYGCIPPMCMAAAATASEQRRIHRAASYPAKNMLRLNVSYSIENIKYNNAPPAHHKSFSIAIARLLTQFSFSYLLLFLFGCSAIWTGTQQIHEYCCTHTLT